MSNEVSAIELETEETGAAEQGQTATEQTESTTTEKQDVKDEVKPQKFNFGNFKDVFEDEDLQDDYFEDEEKFKGFLQKAIGEKKTLKTVAKGKDVIDADPDIKEWMGLTKKSGEELITMAFAEKFAGAGMAKEQAIAKAQERVEELKKNPTAFEDTELEIRTYLRNSIGKKQQQLLSDLENAQKSVDLRSFDEKVLTAAQESVLNTDDFLGLKPSKAKKADLLNGAKDYIAKGELQKALKDPKVLAEVAIYLKYKKEWATTIAERTNGKSELLKKLQTSPTQLKKKGVALSSGTPQKGNGNKKMNVAAFLGKAV